MLLIGYGNELRGDDAVGRLVAETVAAWNLPHVRVYSVRQLTPELAVPLAAARLALFVDARAVSPHAFRRFRRPVLRIHQLSGTSGKQDTVTLNGGAAGVKGLLDAAKDASPPSATSDLPDEPLSGTSGPSPVTLNGGAAGVKGLLDAAKDASPPSATSDLPDEPPRPAESSLAAHTFDPAALLALVNVLYGSFPPAFLITIPAAQFVLGAPLSRPTRQSARSALYLIRRYCNQPFDV